MDDQLDVSAVISGAAYNVLGKFRSYVEHGDLVSIGWEWVLNHTEKMDEFYASDQPRLAAWQLDKALWKVMERYARKERAHFVGYSAKDEAFYSVAMIESLLPRVFDGDPMPDKKEQDEIRTPRDPAESGDYLASYLDVQRAWNRADLTDQERLILLGVHADGDSQQAVAEALGIQRQTVARGHDRAIRKLQKYLGGPAVPDCPYSCECHEGKLRVRPGTRGNDSGRNQLAG